MPLKRDPQTSQTRLMAKLREIHFFPPNLEVRGSNNRKAAEVEKQQYLNAPPTNQQNALMQTNFSSFIFLLPGKWNIDTRRSF